MTDRADEAKLPSEKADERSTQARRRRWLRLCSNVALAAALLGIPWTYLRPDGHGPTLSFVGFVVALLLRSAGPRR